MATIADVARHAGVSMKTVSRVINNEDHVRPGLRDRVMAAIEALDYRPNLAARQLVTSRSLLISVFIHDASVSYFSEIVVSAAAECRRHGYHLVSETFDKNESGTDAVARVTAHLRPDGIILAPPLCNDPAIVDAVERSGTPLVRLAGTGDFYGTAIPVHERAVSRDIVRHLIALGHRRIALIAPPPEHGAAQERIMGFMDAMDEARLAVDPDLIVAGEFSFASGALIAETMLAASPRPTAIFASNDGMALGVMAVARRMGLAIPADLAVAGFDDSPASRMVFPPLTTVRQPIAAMSRAAVEVILGKEARDDAFEHQLMIRGSTTGDDALILDRLDA